MPFRPLRNHAPHVLAATLVVASGCRATARDVDAWKATEQGPRKLVALAGSPRYDVTLRARALLALVTMDPREAASAADGADPVHAFEAAVYRLAARDPRNFPSLLDALVPDVERAMRGASGDRPTAAPTPEQTRAKDAAVVLARRAEAADRERLVGDVMGWYAADFARRSTAGEWDAEECAIEFGPSSAAHLVPAIDAKLDKEALSRLAKLIAERGDEATRDRAVERLLAVEREMEGDAFRAWVDAEIRRALAAAGPLPNERQLDRIALLTRESFVTTGGIGSLRHFASKPAARARLLEIAQRKSPNEAFDGRRTEALSALADHVDASQASALLALALDATNPGTVRELAFDRLGETHSLEALPALAPFVAATGDQPGAEGRTARQLRARTAELLLELGVSPADFFARLPSAPTAAFEPGELQGYANRLAELRPPPDSLLRSELASPVWWRRVVAVHYVARTGTRADRPLLERMARDASPTVGEGFRNRNPAEDTVGKVVTAALAVMDERLSQPQAPR